MDFKNKLENEGREEINASLRKNDEKLKHLLQTKNKKLTCLMYKPTRPITETTEFEHGLQFQKQQQIILGESQPMQGPFEREVILTSWEN